MSSATVFDSELSFVRSCSVSFFSSEELCWSVAREDSSVSFSCSCTQKKKEEEGGRKERREKEGMGEKRKDEEREEEDRKSKKIRV